MGEDKEYKLQTFNVQDECTGTPVSSTLCDAVPARKQEESPFSLEKGGEDRVGSVLPVLADLRMPSVVSQPAWESAPAMFYGGAVDVPVIWGLPLLYC